MLKMIKEQSKINLINNAIENNGNIFSSFKVEFAANDERSKNGNNYIICAIVNQGVLDIKLGCEGNLYNLTKQESNNIKNEIIPA